MRKNLYNTVVGQITKEGKKNVAMNILNEALLSSTLKTNSTLPKLFKFVCRKLGSIIETKTVRSRKNAYIIPFPLNNSRRFYLISKTVVTAVQENKSKISFEDKLIEEIYSILISKQSKSISKKEILINDASIHKANSHYRW